MARHEYAWAFGLQQPFHSEAQSEGTGAIPEKCWLCGSVSGTGPWMQLGGRLWQELTSCIMVVLCFICHFCFKSIDSFSSMGLKRPALLTPIHGLVTCLSQDWIGHECTSLFARQLFPSILGDWEWRWPTSSGESVEPMDLTPAQFGWPASRGRCYSVLLQQMKHYLCL